MSYFETAQDFTNYLLDDLEEEYYESKMTNTKDDVVKKLARELQLDKVSAEKYAQVLVYGYMERVPQAEELFNEYKLTMIDAVSVLGELENFTKLYQNQNGYGSDEDNFDVDYLEA